MEKLGYLHGYSFEKNEAVVISHSHAKKPPRVWTPVSMRGFISIE